MTTTTTPANLIPEVVDHFMKIFIADVETYSPAVLKALQWAVEAGFFVGPLAGCAPYADEIIHVLTVLQLPPILVPQISTNVVK